MQDHDLPIRSFFKRDSWGRYEVWPHPRPQIKPKPYEHPPVAPRRIGLPVSDKPKQHRRGTEIYLRIVERMTQPGWDDGGRTLADVVRELSAEVDVERARRKLTSARGAAR